ncbi:Zn-dependent oxidoreductase [Streptomyces avidinii]
MKSVYAAYPSPDDPLDALHFGEQSEPEPTDADWTVVSVRAASLNHHDLWTLRGAGTDGVRYPMILGCEASGVDESGREVVVSGLLCAPRWHHDPVRDPDRSMLTEGMPGTFAERVAVPRHNLCLKPRGFTHAQASCLSGAWLTAYRMLFTKSGLRAGETVLIQGAGGGVSSALTSLAAAAGFRVWVVTRTKAKEEFALAQGAHRVFAPREPIPEPVDAVMESVGKATWAHSLRAVRPGGSIVVTGATTGQDAIAHLHTIFRNELRVVGSTAGTVDELRRLIRFMELHGLRPAIAAEIPFPQARDGVRLMLEGQLTGKVVFHW